MHAEWDSWLLVGTIITAISRAYFIQLSKLWSYSICRSVQTLGHYMKRNVRRLDNTKMKSSYAVI